MCESKRKCGAQPKFTDEEDQMLVELVRQFGLSSWSKIAHELKNKTSKQCKDRWKNYVNPALNHNEFSEEEDELLMKKVNEVGTRWTIVKDFFPDRSINNIRYRWLNLNKTIAKNKARKAHEKSKRIMINVKKPKSEKPAEIPCETPLDEGQFTDIQMSKTPIFDFEDISFASWFTEPFEWDISSFAF